MIICMCSQQVCLKSKENTSLFVILFPNEVDNTVNETLSLIRAYQTSYPKAKIHVIPVFDAFARAMALDQGAHQVTEPEDLMFFIDVDMTFTPETLARIRLNTVRGKSAYFPIVFSEFDPQITNMFSKDSDKDQISKDAGYWRQFGFGIASLYKTDLKQVKNKTVTSKMILHLHNFIACRRRTIGHR